MLGLTKASAALGITQAPAKRILLRFNQGVAGQVQKKDAAPDEHRGVFHVEPGQFWSVPEPTARRFIMSGYAAEVAAVDVGDRIILEWPNEG
jgi:hypothetical protein